MLRRIHTIAVIFALIFLSGCAFNGKAQYEYSGKSMQPTIHDKDKVIVDLNYYKDHKVKIGDIIAYESSYGEDAAHIKRVLGLPGEFIQIKNGELLVNSKPVDPEFIFDEIWADEKLEEGITLKKDEYFTVGDNPAWSKDSRYDGPLNAEKLIGKVIEIKSK